MFFCGAALRSRIVVRSRGQASVKPTACSNLRPKICSSHENLAYWGLLCGASQIPSSSQLNKAKLLLRASKGLRGRQTIEASRSAWAAF